MKGPTKKPKVDLGIGWSEFFMFLAGLTVFSGLWMESGPEWRNAWNERRLPSKGVIGSALVAVGVFAEACLGIAGARSSRKKELESNERIAGAEKATAEANLARAKIEQRMKPRFLTMEDSKGLLDLLTPHVGKCVDIIVFDHHVDETLRFAGQIASVFVSAGWRVREWESRKATYRLPGASTLVAMAAGHVTDDGLLDIAEQFAGALTALDIDCGISPGTFNCEREFEVGDFHMRLEKPLQVFGKKGVAPFRIQIGAKQLSPSLPFKIIRGVIARPVTPPQA